MSETPDRTYRLLEIYGSAESIHVTIDTVLPWIPQFFSISDIAKTTSRISLRLERFYARWKITVRWIR